MDDVPVPANEVDRWADWITTLEPEYVLNARRRFALTNGLLERAAIASKFAADRELARERIERASGGTPQTAPRLAAGLVSSTVSGLWTDLGLQLWGELQPIELERWVGPFELPGSFTLARVVEHKTNRGLDELTVELLQAPFLPTSDTHKAITKAVDTSSLQIVDDAFDDAVPESWKLRMRGPR